MIITTVKLPRPVAFGELLTFYIADATLSERASNTFTITEIFAFHNQMFFWMNNLWT